MWDIFWTFGFTGCHLKAKHTYGLVSANNSNKLLCCCYLFSPAVSAASHPVLELCKWRGNLKPPHWPQVQSWPEHTIKRGWARVLSMGLCKGTLPTINTCIWFSLIIFSSLFQIADKEAQKTCALKRHTGEWAVPGHGRYFPSTTSAAGRAGCCLPEI